MNWATGKEVLQLYRILSKKEAALRRLVVILLLDTAMLAAALISRPFALLLFYGQLFFYGLFVADLLKDFLSKSVTQEDVSYERITARMESDGVAGQSDAPIYSDKIDRDSHLKKILAVSPYVAASAIVFFLYVFQAAAGIPAFLLYYILFALSFGSLYVFIEHYNAKLEMMEIEDFPPKFSARYYLKILSRLFCETRGCYYVGEVQGTKFGLRSYQRYTHVLVVGPTGERKTTAVIVPQLLFDARALGSAVVPDAKSPSLYNKVAGRWIAEGKKVFLFDAWHPDTIGINPLPDADDRDKLTMVEVLMQEKEEVMREDPFFKSRTKYLMYAVLTLVQTWKDKYCNFASVYHAVRSVDQLEALVRAAPDQVKYLFSDFNSLSSESKVNALTSIRDKLDIFMDRDVRKAFSRSDFRLKMLFEEGNPCLFVIGAPVDKEEQGQKIASLLINLIINMSFKERRLQDVARHRGERNFTPPPLYLYLDELRKLKITRLGDLISIARETKTAVIASVTDLGFFRYYGPDFSSFMSNFRTKLVMGGLDNDSAKYFSDSLGSKKVADYRYVMGRVTLSQNEKPLLDVSGVRQLRDDQLLVFPPTSNLRPFIAKKTPIPETQWINKMEAPAPMHLKDEYRKWGISTDPLVDPVLPTLKDNVYNMAEIIDPNKRIELNPNINLDYFFREMGGGKYLKMQQEEVIATRDDSIDDDIINILAQTGGI